MRWASVLLFVTAACTQAGASEEWFDRLEQRLSFSAADDTLRVRLGGLLSLEDHQIEPPPPGLLFTNGHNLFSPRLGLTLQGQSGPELFGFALVRVDRGFNPANARLRVRLDEYALTYVPTHLKGLNFKVGQFATVIGNWVPRHDAWDNPFITAPLPYEHQTPVYDSEAPSTPADFVHLEADEKYDYLPILWGPSYATGASVSGLLGHFEFAAEIKNAGPASRPEVWSIRDLGFSRPSYSARLGFRPDLRWSLGVSAGDSAYLVPFAANLPPGTSRHDYRQRLLGADLGFAWHHLQVWAEGFDSTFDVPRIGHVRTRAAYVETKYRFSAEWYGALRWNRQDFSRIGDGHGGRMRWGQSIWRLDAAAGFRLSPHAECKVQLSGQPAAGDPDRVNPHLATQFNVRF
jgi:hypothetical protein